MMGYPKERKDAILRKLLPPMSRSVQDVAKEEGISTATLYNWRNQARSKGVLMPDSDATPNGWTAADKFAAVVETAALNQAELSAYCRANLDTHHVEICLQEPATFSHTNCRSGLQRWLQVTGTLAP